MSHLLTVFHTIIMPFFLFLHKLKTCPGCQPLLKDASHENRNFAKLSSIYSFNPFHSELVYYWNARKISKQEKVPTAHKVVNPFRCWAEKAKSCIQKLTFAGQLLLLQKTSKFIQVHLFSSKRKEPGASFTKLTCVSDVTFGNFLWWKAHNFIQ
jgi:hypothetical protein